MPSESPHTWAHWGSTGYDALSASSVSDRSAMDLGRDLKQTTTETLVRGEWVDRVVLTS